MAGSVPRSAAPARHLLTVCIGAALTTMLGVDPAIAQPPPTTIVVTNCDDAGDGSLRWALAAAVSGDTIDLTSLQCSLITLTSAELSTSADDLTLAGAGVAISGSDTRRVFSHLGVGTLQASGITFEHGSVFAENESLGGCIYSLANVSLRDVTVSDCIVEASDDFALQARGAGVYAKGAVSLDHVTIRDNVARPAGGAHYAYVTGAGVASFGALTIASSTIANNRAEGGGVYNFGGGFYSRSAVIESSTISGNHAGFAGAGFVGGSMSISIVNSTISGNESEFRTGGIAANVPTLEVRNSTITANTVSRPSCSWIGGVGLLSWAGTNTIESSIIASNICGTQADDLDIENATPVSGHANLIGAVAAVTSIPDDTLRSDPMLAPLADNGGPTWTHALLPQSPAINHGDNAAGLLWDQRGEGHPRVQNGRADIGAFELELPDAIFANGFDPSGAD